MQGEGLEYGEEEKLEISQAEKRALHRAFKQKVQEQGEHFGHFPLIYYFYKLARIDGLSEEEARKTALQ
jgi:hypothetical protein